MHRARSSSSDAARRWGPWVAAAVMVAATLWVYAPAFEFGTVNYDDPDYLEDNPRVLAGLSGEGAAWAFTTGHASNWHPLTWLSHMLDAELFGADWGAHHAVNVALHALSALLLTLFWAHAAGRPWAALGVAALFALHPLHVESVAWLSERKDVLSTLLWWLCLLAYLGWTRRPSAKGYALLVALFAAGLMAKPMLVTLPVTLLLLDVWPLGRFAWPGARAAEQSGWSAAWSALWPRLREKLPLFALAAASAIATLAVQRAGGAVSTLGGVPLGERLANALVAAATYLGQMLWPLELAVLYPHPGMPAAWKIALSALVVLAISIGVLLAARRGVLAPLVGWLWYLVTLLPVSGLVQVGAQARADRYTYVPLVGIFVLLLYGGAELAARREGLARLRQVAAAGLVVALALLAVQARRQVMVWESSETLFGHALAVTEENYLIESFLGVTLMDRGEVDRALPHLERAVEIRPSFAEGHNHLGVAAERLGRLAEAARRFETAIGYDPEHAEAHNNLANALGDLGRPERALAHYRRALELDPDNAGAEHNLGLTLAAMGRPAEALEHFRRALELDPELVAARGDLGNALLESGRADQAIAEYDRALAALPAEEPQALGLRANRAQALAGLGRLDEARAELAALAELRPGDPRARYFLALVAVAAGDRAGFERELAWLDAHAPEAAAELRRRVGE